MDKRYVDRILNVTEGHVHICPYCGALPANIMAVIDRSIPGISCNHWRCLICNGKFRRIWDDTNMYIKEVRKYG